MSDEIMEIEESFAEMLERSIKTLNTGDKVTGVVTGITPTEIYVDLGTKHAGYIPVSELTDDPTAKVEDLVKVGDEIETFVVRVNDQEGVVTLSKKRLDVVKGWEDIEARPGGADCAWRAWSPRTTRAALWCPSRACGSSFPPPRPACPGTTPMSELLKKKVRLRHHRGQPCPPPRGGLHPRKVQRAERAAAAEKVWAEIEDGKHYTGVVKSLTSYGAFVDIGGVDGMVHISELSWSRIKHPSEVVSVGDTVDVYVISADPEKKKISLGMKDHSQDPWTVFTSARTRWAT